LSERPHRHPGEVGYVFGPQQRVLLGLCSFHVFIV
jgi:hypothetical protein